MTSYSCSKSIFFIFTFVSHRTQVSLLICSLLFLRFFRWVLHVCECGVWLWTKHSKTSNSGLNEVCKTLKQLINNAAYGNNSIKLKKERNYNIAACACKSRVLYTKATWKSCDLRTHFGELWLHVWATVSQQDGLSTANVIVCSCLLNTKGVPQ